MSIQRLWPLLPPVVVVGFWFLFLKIKSWLDSRSSGCTIYEKTGIHCPGCGGTRSAHDLASGDLLSALGHHLPLTVGVFAFVFFSLFLIVRVTILGKPAPKLPAVPTSTIWLCLSAIVLFTILRNIPVWPFNLLAP